MLGETPEHGNRTVKVPNGCVTIVWRTIPVGRFAADAKPNCITSKPMTKYTTLSRMNRAICSIQDLAVIFLHPQSQNYQFTLARSCLIIR